MASLRKRTGKAAAGEGVYSTSNKAASTDRTESWARSRMLGFASFVLPLSVIAVLCTEKYGGAAATTIFHTEWTMEPVWKTALYFALWASKEVLLNIFKYFLVVWAFGWSQEDYAQMIGPRHEWDGKEADRLVDKYGKYRTKIMDAINRRLGHTVINIFRIYFYVYLCDNNDLRLKTAMLQVSVERRGHTAVGRRLHRG